MNPDKRKIVFIGSLGVILLFMIGYGIMVFGNDKDTSGDLKETRVPRLGNDQKDYNSRVEAVDALREKKPSVAPSIYEETKVNDQGYYDPYLEEKQKDSLIDSLLEKERSEPESILSETMADSLSDTVSTVVTSENDSREFLSIGQGHEAFFLVTKKEAAGKPVEREGMKAFVYGDQVVRKDERLVLELPQDVIIGRDTLAAHTLLYAQCQFKPNRLFLTIRSGKILNRKLEAYDVADGQLGIYLKNNFRSRASSQVLGDVVDEVHVTGLPQVGGLKSLFQRSNRSVKVHVFNQYQLILKPTL